ncbi:MAG: hypothetical protein CL484_00295 [Acidobacteria bacterium]|nr:hypothetical protein [Acidobacteriota bacterium]|tara:strand:+ start:1557 stop:1748 length:192 start_codon:yes stop_codon:yes gene_type:complete
MKPFYKSRKFWSAVISAVATVVAYYRDPELAKLIATVGATLIAGFALEDHGKARASIELGNDA